MDGFLQMVLWLGSVTLEALRAAFAWRLCDALTKSNLPGDLLASWLPGIAMLVLLMLIVFGSRCALRPRATS